jgi:hypothetical protein
MTEQMPKEREPSIPQLGMAGIAFASFLVALTLPPKPEIDSALMCFATAMPLIIAGVFLRSIARRTEVVKIRELLQLLWHLVAGIGDIAAGIGVYWMIRFASAPPARLFLQLSLALWFGIGLLDLVLRVVHQSRRRSTQL